MSGKAPSAPRLPTHLDLPSTDGLPADNTYQPAQWRLLIESVISHLDGLHPDQQYLLADDLGIYYRITDPPLRGCRCPDLLYVPGVPPVLPDAPCRRSYVLWNEQVPPMLVVELVSDESRGTEEDTTPEEGKFWIYENAIKATYYAIYDPQCARLKLFHLRNGKYRRARRDASGLYPIPPMKLKLGTHRETFMRMTFDWLRFFDENGVMLLPEAEVQTLWAEKAERQAHRNKRRADEEKRRAKEERKRADAMAAKLREMGIDPERL